MPAEQAGVEVVSRGMRLFYLDPLILPTPTRRGLGGGSGLQLPAQAGRCRGGEQKEQGIYLTEGAVQNDKNESNTILLSFLSLTI